MDHLGKFIVTTGYRIVVSVDLITDLEFDSSQGGLLGVVNLEWFYGE
jgi:hypothetical protein